MINLLRFHFYFSKRMVLLSAVIVAVFLILHTGSTINIVATPLTTMFIMYIPSLCISYLLNDQLSYLIRMLPVTYKQFVQSTYLYATILFAFIFIPSLIFISYQFYNGYAGSFKVSFFLGVIAFCIVTTGGILKSYFKHPTKAEKSIASSDTFFYLLFIAIPHAMLTIIFSLYNLTFLGALLVPLCCPFIFYKFYKASIHHFEQAEY